MHEQEHAVPTEIGEAIDYRYELKEQMTKLNQHVASLKLQIANVEEAIESELKELGLTGAKGSIAQVSVSTTDRPIFEDFNEYFQWFKQDPDNRMALNRALNSRTIKAMREEGINPPGVGTMMVTKLSLRKL